MSDQFEGFDRVSELVRVIEVDYPRGLEGPETMWEISVYRQLRPDSPVFYARCLKLGGESAGALTTFPVIFGDSENAVLNTALEHLRAFEFPVDPKELGPPYRP